MSYMIGSTVGRGRDLHKVARNLPSGRKAGVGGRSRYSFSQPGQPGAGEVDYERRPIGLFKPLDYLNRGQYVVLNPLRRLSDRSRHYTVGEYLKSMWDGLRGKERSQTTDVLGNLGWQPTSTAGKIARGIVGLAGDIFLDPTTYFTPAALTKLGKAAKAGRLVRIGGAVYDLGKAEQSAQVLSKLTKAAEEVKAGKEMVEAAKGLFKGIRGADQAAQIVDYLKKFGQEAEVIKLAPTWHKQFKSGQRALLQFQLPKFMGGYSARVSPLNLFKIPTRAEVTKTGEKIIRGGEKLGDALEKRLFRAATNASAHIRAGRMVADRNVWSALPEATLEMRNAARKGNLINIGGESYNLANKTQWAEAVGALNKHLSATGAKPETIAKASEVMGKIKGKAEGLADEASKVMAGFGLNTTIPSYSSLQSKHAAALLANKDYITSFGRAANGVASVFNIIPTAAKKIRRYAEGTSTAAGNYAAEGLESFFGKEGMAKLTKGLTDESKIIVKMGGKDVPVKGVQEIAALRVSPLEALGTAVARRELAKYQRMAAKEGKKITIEQIIASLDPLEAGAGAENNILARIQKLTRDNKLAKDAAAKDYFANARVLRKLKKQGYEYTDNALKWADKTARSKRKLDNISKIVEREALGIRPSRGLDPESIGRYKQVLREWNDPDAILDLLGARKFYEDAQRGMGAVPKSISHNLELTTSLAHIPRRAEVDASEKLLRSGSKYNPDQLRSATRGMDFFEARHGFRSKAQTQYLLENYDNVIAVGADGGKVYGRDVLAQSYTKGLKDADKMLKKANDAKEAFEIQKGRVGKLNEQISLKKGGRKAQEELLNSQYAHMTKKAERDYAKIGQRIANAQDSADNAAEVLATRQAATRQAQKEVDIALKNQELTPTARNMRELKRKTNALAEARKMEASAAKDLSAAKKRLEDLSKLKETRLNALDARKADVAQRVGRRMEEYEAGINRLRSRAERWTNLLNSRKATADELEKQYETFLKEITETLFKADESKGVKFSTDIRAEMMRGLNAAQKKMQIRGVAKKCIEFGEDFAPDKPVPVGKVRLSDIFSEATLSKLLNGAETSGEYADFMATVKNPEFIAQLKNKVIDFELVRPIKEMIEITNPPQGTITKLYDWVHSIIKPYLLASFGFQSRNTVSSFMMSWVAGDFDVPQQGVYNLFRSFLYNYGIKKNQLFNIRGKEYAIDDIVKMLERYGGLDAGRVVSEYLPKATDEINNAAMNITRDSLLAVTKPFGAMADKTEKVFRLSHFMTELQKGATIEDAIESVALHFYDYNDLSKFEKHVTKRFLPFYVFTRKNLEANIRYLIDKRWYLRIPQVAANNINSMTDDDPNAVDLRLLDNPRDSWLADAGAFRLPWGQGRRLAMMQGFLPQTDIVQLTPKEFVQTGIGMITPILKTPYEVINNKNTFTGRELRTPSHQREHVGYWPWPVYPEVAHVLNTFKPLVNAGKLIDSVAVDRATRYGGSVSPNVKDEAKWYKRLGKQELNNAAIKYYDKDPDKVRDNYIRALDNEIHEINWVLKKNPNYAPGLKKIYQDRLSELEAEKARAGRKKAK